MGRLSDDFNRLNDQQTEIIKKFGKSSLIVAGPGTGKTRTISVLIGKQLEKNLKLKDILALTFSSDAAEELKERVLEYYPQSFDQCWISTFHSFCSRILREQYHVLGIKPDFNLLTGFKEALLMDIICKKQQPEAFHEFGKVITKRGFQQEVLTFISLLKSNLVEPNEFEQVIENSKELSQRTKNRCKELLSLFRLYEKERSEAGYLDFRDLISLTIKTLKDPDTAAIYREKFKAILVDEFQDTDPAQYLLLTLLNGDSENIKTAVIGDPHQSIYRFRGADPSMMSDKSPFKKKYKAKVFPLKKNYRSAKSIVNVANKIKWAEKSATDSTLEANSKENGFVKYYKVRDELDEAKLISRKIASMVIYENEEIKKYNPSDIAVLVRNNFQIDLITEQLASLHIPFEIAGDMKFFKSEEVIVLTSLLKIIYSLTEQERDDAIKRAFTSPIFDISPLWTQAVTVKPEYSSNIRQAIEEIKSENFEKLPETDEETKKKAKEFADNISYIEICKDDDVEEIFNRLIVLFSDKLAKIDSLESRNLLIFRSMIAEFCELFEATCKRKTKLPDLMENFDEWLAYYALTLEKNETSGNGVKIMTIHQSKGLEFPIVFVCGLAEGTFPVRQRENILISTNALEILKNEFNKQQREISFFNPYPVSFEEHLEEERRLFFVAITRAKEGLIMTTPLQSGGETQFPAPFIKEIEIKEDADSETTKPLSISELRTEIAKLSPEDTNQIEPYLQETEKELSSDISIHGIHPRKFNAGLHDEVTLPENFAFSASSIKTYIECPRKFFFQNILRIQRPDRILQAIFDTGNAYHKCLEVLHNPESVWEKGKLPTDEELDKIIEDEAMPILINQNCFAKSQNKAAIKYSLQNYINAVYQCCQFPCRQTIGVEKPFNFQLNGCKIIGRFDRISKDSSGNIIISDYKTSSAKSAEILCSQAFPDSGFPMEIQMPLYLLACKHNEMPNASASLIFLKEKPYSKRHKLMSAGFLKSAAIKIGKGGLSFAEQVDDKLCEFEEKIKIVLDKIVKDKHFKAQPSMNEEAATCINRKENKSCDFAAFCDYALELEENSNE